MLVHLAAARRWSQNRQSEDAELVQGYLRDGGPFPDWLPVIVLTGRLLTDFARLVGDWAAWAEQEVESWPAEIAAAEPNRAAMERVAAYEPPPDT